jgi:uncharacterized protein (DUF2062 family)
MIRSRLRRWLPSEEKLRAQRSLRWLGPLLRRPWLWHLSRRRVALGAAIGVFFGFLIPVLQIAAAAGIAVLLRANLPVAAAATLVSNPLTYVPIWIAAYRTGAALLGEPIDAAAARAQAEALAEQLDAGDADARTWSQRLLAIGKPLMLGLIVFAIAGATVTWFAVSLLWTLAVRWRRRRAGRGGAGIRLSGE